MRRGRLRSADRTIHFIGNVHPGRAEDSSRCSWRRSKKLSIAKFLEAMVLEQMLSTILLLRCREKSLDTCYAKLPGRREQRNFTQEKPKDVIGV